jgi:WD40 repeat protein
MTQKGRNPGVAAVAVCLAIGAVTLPGVLTALKGGQPARAPASAEVGQNPHTDLFGDPLPREARARLGTIRFRYPGQAMVMHFSPDGKTLVSGHNDGILRVWETGTGKPLHQFAGQLAGNAFGVAFSTDGKSLIFLGRDGRLQVRDVASGKEVRSLALPTNGFQAFALSRDGKTAAMLTPDQTLHFWDVAEGREIRKAASPFQGKKVVQPMGQMTWSPDGKILACGNSNGASITIRFVRLADGKELEPLAGPPDNLTALAYSPDGKMLAVGATGQRVHVYDLATARDLHQIASLGTQHYSVAIAPDGKQMAVGNNGSAVDLVELPTGKVLHRVPDQAWGSSQCVAFSPDGKVLATATSDATIRLWDVATGKELLQTPGHRGTIGTVAFSPDGKLVASTASDRAIRLWDVATAREVRQFTRPERPATAAGFPMAIAFSADGKVLAAVWGDGLVCRWDVTSGKSLRQSGESDKGHQVAVFSPDGALLARAAADGGVQIWEVSTGRKLRRLGGQPGQPAQPQFQTTIVAFSPDSRTLAMDQGNGFNPYISGSGSLAGMPPQALGRGVRLWEVATGKERDQIPAGTTPPMWTGGYSFTGGGINGGWMVPFGSGVSKLMFSPDGRTLAIAGDSVRLWDLALRRERRLVDGQGPYALGHTMAFSPDGKLLGLGGFGTFAIYDVASGMELCRRSGHDVAAASMAFSPDGRTLATGGTDSTVLLWNVQVLVEEGRRRQLDPSAAQLAEYWKDLGAADAGKAYRAVWGLARVPHKAVPFLRDRLHPVPLLDSKHLARLVADLEHKRYAVRDQASRELERLGDLADSALRKALEGDPPLELRRRAEQILEKTGGPVTDPVQLRTLRAVEALEHAATAEARQLLEELAGGAAEARQTREARAALARLSAPKAAAP